MLHLLILLICHLSYIWLGKLDSTIPKPKPHLTLTCFVKLLAYIPFNVGLQLTYFQNVTKLIRDLLLFLYIIGQYYTFEYDLIFRLLGFEFFAIFALPLIMEGWMANSPNYIYYLLKFYSSYALLFFNQFFLHIDRMTQTIFFFVIIEIPSMVYFRQDKDLPQIRMNSYIFKLVQLPKAKIAILHCANKGANDSNQLELAIACIKNTTRRIIETDPQDKEYNQYSRKQNSNEQNSDGKQTFDEWVVIKKIEVYANTSDLNYIEKTNTLIISSCSDLKIYNANNLQLLKVINHPRSLKKLSFINYDRYYSFLKKVNDSQTMISINDSIFNTIQSQHVIPQDIQPEIIKFIKYPCSFNMIDKYVYTCVPSDRLNCLIIVDVKDHERERILSSSNIIKQQNQKQNQSNISLQSLKQKEINFSNKPDIDLDNPEYEEELYDYFLSDEEQSDTQITSEFLKNNIQLDSETHQRTFEITINETNKDNNHKRRKSRKRGMNNNNNNAIEEINLYEHISKNKSINYRESKSEDGIREYVIDCSAIKDILVHEHLLVISCSENIVFFDLQLRRVVKKISTLNFDTRVHWIRITHEFTYYLISNEIRTWIAKQSNKLNDFIIIQHFNFYDIQYILENENKNCLYVIYNNTLYKQKIAVIDLSQYC